MFELNATDYSLVAGGEGASAINIVIDPKQLIGHFSQIYKANELTCIPSPYAETMKEYGSYLIAAGSLIVFIADQMGCDE